jgi:hypothetical protein
MKKSKVPLTAEERQDRLDLIAAGKAAAPKRAPARILLQAEAAPGGPAGSDEQIAEAVEGSAAPGARIRRRFVAPGLEAALGRKPPDRPSRPRTRDGRAEARLSARAGAPPPEGRTAWTRQLLADQLVALEVVGAVSDETGRRTLNKPS